ncbi:hypothetical protein HYX16_01565 [Candidatus Woesearchaeota archaeon]|nr:hypothetical protein [Candidatus Woesearchaeota archaeon]
MKIINKKGISPLIATVLLIGFTIALAAVVITWGSGFVERVTLTTEERTTKSLVCTNDLVFEIKKVGCTSNTVVIDNKANIAIKEISLRFFNVNGNFLGKRNTGVINGFEIKTVTPTVPAGDPAGPGVPVGSTKVEGLATITIEGKDAICSETIRTKTFVC